MLQNNFPSAKKLHLVYDEVQKGRPKLGHTTLHTLTVKKKDTDNPLLGLFKNLFVIQIN